MLEEFTTNGRRRTFQQPNVTVASADNVADEKPEETEAASPWSFPAQNAVESAEASESIKEVEAPVKSEPTFTVVEVASDKVREFSREYSPVFDTVKCIADVSMLLQYMVATERKHNVTLSFPAYGIDPIVFEKAQDAMVGMPEDAPPCVIIPVPGRDESAGEMYEMIEVDGALYLSCISESLNPDYLHQVIAEASEGVFTHGEYIYTLVGPRPLSSDAGNQTFVETLKLNSYELSVLLGYMSNVPGVDVCYGAYNGREAITFTKR